MLLAVLLVLAIYNPCDSKTVLKRQSESVVSVYTTTADDLTTTEHSVYREIATNLAEKVTAPVLSFLGFDNNETVATTTKKPLHRVIIEDVDKKDKPYTNHITQVRDTEELSSEATKKDRKPEKITFYTSEAKDSKETNEESNEIDSNFDEPRETKPRQGGFVYILEFISSIVQLAWGAIVSYFNPPSKKS